MLCRNFALHTAQLKGGDTTLKRCLSLALAFVVLPTFAQDARTIIGNASAEMGVDKLKKVDLKSLKRWTPPLSFARLGGSRLAVARATGRPLVAMEFGHPGLCRYRTRTPRQE
jgi:hypothetical protein